MRKGIFRTALLLLIIAARTRDCYALEENEKLWLGLNAQQTLTPDEKWMSFIFTQARFIDNSHPWQSGLVEGGIGYYLFPLNSIWAGYRWTGHNPNNGFYQEHRFFQQYILQVRRHELYPLNYRSRLEEIIRGDQSQVAIRLRQRLSLEIKIPLFSSKIFPVMYEEIFLQLNNTNYTSSRFISENRLFLGFNWRTSDKTWWEIGYINQYQMRTPMQSQNQMSHVASVIYNFT